MTRAQELADPQGMFLRLHALLHPESSHLAALLAAGASRTTLLALYPFQPEEWFEPLVKAHPASDWKQLSSVISSGAERIAHTDISLAWEERWAFSTRAVAFGNSGTGVALLSLLTAAAPELVGKDRTRFDIGKMLTAIWLAESWPDYPHLHGTREGIAYLHFFAGVDVALRKLAFHAAGSLTGSA